MPLPSTMTPIATQTLAANASSITFSSIPQTYTDLVVVMVFGQSAGDDVKLRFNGDTGANYSSTRLAGDGSVATSSRTTSETGIQPRTPNNPSTAIVSMWTENINNYSNTTTYKTTIGRYSYPSGFTTTHTGLWRNTAAITSITLLCQAQSWTTGTTATIYGIKAA
jgi:hypothetical protein